MKFYERIIQVSMRQLLSITILVMLSILLLFFLISKNIFIQIPFTDFIDSQTNTAYFSNKSYPVIPFTFSILFLLTCGLFTAVPISVVLAFNYNRIQNFTPISKSILEVIAAIPTIFYGLGIMLLFIAISESLFLHPLFNAFCMGITFGIMLIPTILNLTEDAFSDIPLPIFEDALGLGANKFQIALLLLIPMALPNILAATIIAICKAITELTILALVVGIFRVSPPTLTILILSIILLSGFAIYLRNFKNS